jgi:hypothetical protein
MDMLFDVVGAFGGDEVYQITPKGRIQYLDKSYLRR